MDVDAFALSPRPDELLYSVIARYVRWFAPGRPSEGVRLLFGTRFANAPIELPNRLDLLSKRFGLSYDADRLCDDHTLAPYYSAFVPESTRLRLRRGMKGSDEDLYMFMGIAAFRSGGVGRLRFCSECLDEMCLLWGNAYWRRDHQLPGVMVCPIHGSVLRESTVDPRRASRHEYVPATPMTCPPDAREVLIDPTPQQLSRCLDIAVASAALLATKNGPADFDELTVHYREALRRAGLMKAQESVDQVALARAFSERFGEVVHLLPGLTCGMTLRGGWLEALTRRQRKSVHPLEHVLLRDLLASRPQATEDRLRGPWPCRNPLAPHHGEMVVKNLRVYRNKGPRVGVFTCECGYAYTRSIDHMDQLGPARFKEYGPLLAPELSVLVSSGLSLRSVAARLGLNPKTVASLMLAHGIETRWSIKPSTTNVFARAELPISKADNDRVPAVRRSRPRKDWSVIDADVCERVKNVVAEILATVPPVRLTASRIQRQAVGGRDWLVKRKSKLPAANAALASAIESVGCFQERRIAYCIRSNDSGSSSRPWEIMRAAGLRSDALPLILRQLGVRAGGGGQSS